MKKLILLITLFTSMSYAQVGIGTNKPDASSVLDITSTNKGVLFPRIALTNVTDNVTIKNPTTGLFVYNTGTASTFTYKGLVMWDGTKWMATDLTELLEPEIEEINCLGASIYPKLLKGKPYVGVMKVPYFGGNGGKFQAIPSIPSTGNTGLVATLQNGGLDYGTGELIFNVTGTPKFESSSIAAMFDIDFLGKNCTVEVGRTEALATTAVLSFSGTWVPAMDDNGIRETSSNDTPLWEIAGSTPDGRLSFRFVLENNDNFNSTDFQVKSNIKTEIIDYNMTAFAGATYHRQKTSVVLAYNEWTGDHVEYRVKTIGEDDYNATQPEIGRFFITYHGVGPGSNVFYILDVLLSTPENQRISESSASTCKGLIHIQQITSSNSL